MKNIKCPICKEDGYVECPFCEGRKIVKNVSIPEEKRTFENFRILCPHCGGSGKIICTQCNGSGVIQ